MKNLRRPLSFVFHSAKFNATNKTSGESPVYNTLDAHIRRVVLLMYLHQNLAYCDQRPTRL
jgi:hypothetical protein